MKVNKISSYSPDYPKKGGLLPKLGAAAAVAVLAVSSAACRPQFGGAPLVSEPPQTTGGIAIETDEPVLDGEVALDDTEVVTEAPALMGDVVISPEEP